MQNYNNIVTLTKEFVKSLEDDNVIYAEVRFAPLKHTEVLNGEEVVKAVLEGLKSNKVIINLILCCYEKSGYQTKQKLSFYELYIR